MKKLLCLLLSVLLVLSFAACESEEDDDDRRSSRRSKKGDTTSSASSDYEDAIDLLMKVNQCDITKNELKKMFPDALWDYFEDEEGMTLDDCYDMISESLADQRADLEEEFGEDFTLQYEIVNKKEVDEDEFDDFKETMKDYYGIGSSSFGDCYEVEIEGTMSGEYEEETGEMTWHVVEIDGSWYIAEILMDGFT